MLLCQSEYRPEIQAFRGNPERKLDSAGQHFAKSGDIETRGGTAWAATRYWTALQLLGARSCQPQDMR
jgi:hypothetical protein